MSGKGKIQRSSDSEKLLGIFPFSHHKFPSEFISEMSDDFEFSGTLKQFYRWDSCSTATRGLQNTEFQASKLLKRKELNQYGISSGKSEIYIDFFCTADCPPYNSYPPKALDIRKCPWKGRLVANIKEFPDDVVGDLVKGTVRDFVCSHPELVFNLQPGSKTREVHRMAVSRIESNQEQNWFRTAGHIHTDASSNSASNLPQLNSTAASSPSARRELRNHPSNRRRLQSSDSSISSEACFANVNPDGDMDGESEDSFPYLASPDTSPAWKRTSAGSGRLRKNGRFCKSQSPVKSELC